MNQSLDVTSHDRQMTSISQRKMVDDNRYQELDARRDSRAQSARSHNRRSSFESSMRLTGSLAYQTINRHRYPE